jgi:hypothetical protein
MDLLELDRRLQQLAQDLHRRDKLRRDLQQLAEQVRELENERAKWQDRARDASEDLEKLEGIGLARLFHTLLGDRSQRIDDEREQLLQARLRHDECDAGLEPLHTERARIEAELRALADVEPRRVELLRHKEEVLAARGGDVAQRLIESAQRLGELADQGRETDEAIAAGRRVLPELDAADSELRGARSWGQLDLLGGGLITSLAKHSRIDRARSRVEQAQRCLRDLVRELRDVDFVATDLTIDVGGFLRFADVFFDNLISDWVVQSRIKNALDRIVETRDRVRQVVWDLERHRRKLEQLLADARGERAAWIEQAG